MEFTLLSKGSANNFVSTTLLSSLGQGVHNGVDTSNTMKDGVSRLHELEAARYLPKTTMLRVSKVYEILLTAELGSELRLGEQVER